MNTLGLKLHVVEIHTHRNPPANANIFDRLIIYCISSFKATIVMCCNQTTREMNPSNLPLAAGSITSG